MLGWGLKAPPSLDAWMFRSSESGRLYVPSDPNFVLERVLDLVGDMVGIHVGDPCRRTISGTLSGPRLGTHVTTQVGEPCREPMSVTQVRDPYRRT